MSGSALLDPQNRFNFIDEHHVGLFVFGTTTRCKKTRWQRKLRYFRKALRQPRLSPARECIVEHIWCSYHAVLHGNGKLVSVEDGGTVYHAVEFCSIKWLLQVSWRSGSFVEAFGALWSYPLKLLHAFFSAIGSMLDIFWLFQNLNAHVRQEAFFRDSDRRRWNLPNSARGEIDAGNTCACSSVNVVVPTSWSWTEILKSIGRLAVRWRGMKGSAFRPHPVQSLLPG